MNECKTKFDAQIRMMQARTGSLVEPEEDYLLELRKQAYYWISQIEYNLAKIQLDKETDEDA